MTENTFELNNFKIIMSALNNVQQFRFRENEIKELLKLPFDIKYTDYYHDYEIPIKRAIENHYSDDIINLLLDKGYVSDIYGNSEVSKPCTILQSALENSEHQIQKRIPLLERIIEMEKPQDTEFDTQMFKVVLRNESLGNESLGANIIDKILKKGFNINWEDEEFVYLFYDCPSKDVLIVIIERMLKDKVSNQELLLALVEKAPEEILPKVINYIRKPT